MTMSKSVAAISIGAMLVLDGVRAQDDECPQFLRNANYVGRGYNILRGNPRPVHDTSQIDPGWTHSIFNAESYNLDDPAPASTVCGESWLLPAGVEFFCDAACSFSFGASDVMSSEDLRESWQNSVEISGSGGFLGNKYSFKASHDYQLTTEKHLQDHSQFIETRSTCSAYDVRMVSQAEFRPPLREGFVEAVRSLPDALPEDASDAELFAQFEAYVDFLEIWGTHYSRRVRFGATYGYQFELTQTQLETLEQEGHDISASAKISTSIGLFGSASGSTETEIETNTESATTFENNIVSKTEFSYGGKPRFDGTDQNNHALWQEDAYKNPLPIEYGLAFIPDLLTDEYFPDHDVAKLEGKRTVVHNLATEYCQIAEARGEISCADFIGADFGTPVDPPLQEVSTAIYGGGSNFFTDRAKWEESGRTPIREIHMWTDEGDSIDLFSIQTTFEGLTTDSSPARHGTRGENGKTFVVPKNDPIVRVEVHADSRVRGLEFITSSGQSSGLFGARTKRVTSVNLPGELLFLEGNAGEQLDNGRLAGIRFVCKSSIVDEVVCEKTTETIGCPSGKRLKILAAEYGRTEAGWCIGNNTNTECRLTSGQALQALSIECDGLLSCDVTATNEFFGGDDPCVGIGKYLRFQYECRGILPPVQNRDVVASATTSTLNATGVAAGAGGTVAAGGLLLGGVSVFKKRRKKSAAASSSPRKRPTRAIDIDAEDDVNRSAA